MSVGVALPAAFWLVCVGVDHALGLTGVIGEPWTSVLSAVCALIGVFWILWAWSYLLFVGQGLPLEVFGRALHPTQVLVTTGPYAYTRNPMVLGMLFLMLMIAFANGRLSGFVAVPVIALGSWLYLSVFEERGLVARFGDDYERYRASSYFPALDGLRAQQFCLVRSQAERELPAPVRRLRDELELQVAVLREGKARLAEDEYYRRLEILFVQMARLYETNAPPPTAKSE